MEQVLVPKNDPLGVILRVKGQWGHKKIIVLQLLVGKLRTLANASTSK
jgi:hypothetical protein